MKPLSPDALRSLVCLLDDEDPASLDLVKKEILTLGERVLPFLEELRAKSEPSLAARVDAMTVALRLRRLKTDFAALAADAQTDLEKGAFLLCRFAYPGVDYSVYSGWLDRVAAKIQDDLPSDADAAQTFQKVNGHLFRAMGFAGNEARYYDPDNSFLHRVIETRRGIPVTLAVLYLLVAGRLKLPVFGVGTPGHFLVGFRPGPYACYLDPFHRGRLLDLGEVRRMLVRSGYEYRPEFIEPCSPREILVRMMRNLIAVYQRSSLSERAESLASLVDILLSRGETFG